MNYYLLYNKIIMRGNADDVNSFEIFQNGNWQEEYELAWELLFGGMSDFKQITENEAMKLGVITGGN